MILQFAINSKRFIMIITEYIKYPANSEIKRAVQEAKTDMIRDISVAATLAVHRGSVIKVPVDTNNRCVMCTAVLTAQELQKAQENKELLCSTCVKIMAL